MDTNVYIKRITWARNVIIPVIVLTIISFVGGLTAGFLGLGDAASIQWLLSAINILSTAAWVVYIMGYWAMAERYGVKLIKKGIGLAIVGTVVVVVFSSFIQLIMQDTSIFGIISLLLGLGAFWLAAAGYMVLGSGLKKLESSVGSRARTLGGLVLWVGISLATIIFIPVTAILSIVTYIVSWKLFTEEIKKH